MFKRILLPLDRSPLAECVLPHAFALARVFSSQLTVLHVMDVASRGSWRRAVDPLNWQIRQAEADAYLRQVAARFKNAGLDVESKTLEGPAADEVLKFARTDNSDLIILSSHGQSGLSGWNVSSVVQKVILRAATSIMIVRAFQPSAADATEAQYHRLFVPLDGSQRAECVLPVATALAGAQKAQLLLAQMIERPEMPRRTPLSHDDAELADRVVERNRAEATAYLDELEHRVGGNVETRVIMSDHAMTGLHGLVDQENINLVLACAHGSSGQTRWPYGSVVTSFIIYGTTPLLIVQDASVENISPTRAEVVIGNQHPR